MINAQAITLDIDWAPDFVIDYAAQILLEHRVPATWFVTHASPALDRLRAHSDLFELGIHPNFFPGSSHGASIDEVLQFCMDLVPEARSVRMHGLFQNYLILDAIMQGTPITVDSSLFLYEARFLQPTRYWRFGEFLTRVPYFWEDDIELGRPSPRWATRANPDEGLQIYTFHPLHIYLNSASFAPYTTLKERVPHLMEASPGDIDSLVDDGPGTGAFFRELVAKFATRHAARTLIEIASEWNAAHAE